VTDLSQKIGVGYRDVYRSIQLSDTFPDIQKLPEGNKSSVQDLALNLKQSERTLYYAIRQRIFKEVIFIP
jgi:hypothetical protein